MIPNPWDPGSARYLAGLGFKALATTSSGFAWSQGRGDNRVPLAVVLTHIEQIAAAVDIPVSADFEAAFAIEPADVGANVARAGKTGIAGLSVEDSTRKAATPLFDFTLAVERVRAAREALEGTGIVLTARSEGYIAGRPDLTETLRRLTAYAEAGADCLYAPGIRTHAEIRAVVEAVRPKPVNVLVYGHASMAELADLGVRRISVGGALARTAWTGFMAAAQEIMREGTFRRLAAAVPSAEMAAQFARD